MAYDPKYRTRVLDHVDKGHTIRATADLFGISPSTITCWQKLRRKTGSLHDRPRETRHKKIDPVKLIAYYESNPDSYLFEAAEAFGCSVVAIFKALRRLGITRKKNETLCGKL